MNQVFLILGSNIDPEVNIPAAVLKLRNRSELNLLEYSSIWRTRPVGSSSDDFFNLAAHIETPLNQVDLKSKVLRTIEHELGRIRMANKYAARTIDLDIVIFNDKILDSHLFRYDYMILPFSELLPELVDPNRDLTMKKLASTIRPFSTAKKIILEK